MNKSGPAPTWQLGTKRRHITAATSESTRTNIPNHGDERRLRQTGQDTRGTRAESLLGDGARDLKRALYPARWNATCVPHDQSVGPVGLHGWEPPPGHSPQQVRNDAHADGRWEMGDGRWDPAMATRGGDQLVRRSTLDRLCFGFSTFLHHHLECTGRRRMWRVGCWPQR